MSFLFMSIFYFYFFNKGYVIDIHLLGRVFIGYACLYVIVAIVIAHCRVKGTMSFSIMLLFMLASNSCSFDVLLIVVSYECRRF